MKMFIRKTTIACAATAALSLAGASMASATTIDFETNPGNVSYTTTTSATYATVNSADEGLPDASSHGKVVKFHVEDPTSQAVYISWNISSLNLKLKDVIGTYDLYLPTGQQQGWPYMYFGVDTDGNGASDALVIPWPTTYSVKPQQGQWATTGIDRSSEIHVENSRPGLSSGEFDNIQTGTLGDLLDNHPAWGDYQVTLAKIAFTAGADLNEVSPVTAYIDNITVPEPSSLAIFVGLGGLALLSRRTRRKIA